jgi:hypothetical protein
MLITANARRWRGSSDARRHSGGMRIPGERISAPRLA